MSCSSARVESGDAPSLDAAVADRKARETGSAIILDGSGADRGDTTDFYACRWRHELPLSRSDAGDGGGVCEFAIPEPPALTEYDFDKVNIRVEPPSGPSEDLLYVRSATGCDPTPGWFYDVETAPTRVVLCPEICERTYQIPGVKLLLFHVNCPL